MSTTVLVVGGTGALGAPTMQRLREDGYRVRLLVRDPKRLPRRSDDVEYVTGDLENPDVLRSALSGCQVVHVSVRGGPTAEQFDRIEHHGTARLAQLAAQTGANRLTYVSHSLAAPDAPAADLRATLHAEEASRLVVCRTRYSGPPTSWIPCPVTSAVSAPRPRPPTSRPCTWSRQPTSPDWSPDASRFPKQPGISNDYYIRLERGKETRPSPEVIDALARALQMEPVEHEHLRSLVARGTPTPEPPPTPSRAVSCGVRILLDSLRPNPAHVVARNGDLLAWNPGGLRLLADLDDWPVFAA